MQVYFAVLDSDKFGEGSHALRTAGVNTVEFVFAIAIILGATICLAPIEITTPQ